MKLQNTNLTLLDNWPSLIKAFRKTHGLKQEVLAILLGVDQTTISRWERGRDRPSLSMQKRLRDRMWKREDSALEASVRMARFSPLLSTVVDPDSKVIETSQSYGTRFALAPAAMRGHHWSRFVGDPYYERFIVPVKKAGLYGGDIAQIDFLSPAPTDDGSNGICHSSVVTVFGTGGLFVATQNQIVAGDFGSDAPTMRIIRFDEMLT